MGASARALAPGTCRSAIHLSPLAIGRLSRAWPHGLGCQGTLGQQQPDPCTTMAPPARRYAARLQPARLFPFDQAWAPSADSLAPPLFTASLLPYLGFLYHFTKSGKAPKLTLFGFYFLLVFVGATIPAGIYGLHGGAESLLTITNLLIVLGLRQAIKGAEQQRSKEEPAQEQTTSNDATSKPDLER